jgi:hypothetical protein
MICRTQEQLGSRLAAQRVCKTADDWRREARDQADGLERTQRAGGASSF